MNDVFRDNGFVLDGRVHVADDEAIGDRAMFVSKARLTAERDALRPRGRDVGVELAPGDRLEDIAEDLAWIGAIAVRFPKFGDGRGYSLARLLRERHGWTGELRAVGDVLWDQIEAFRRVGFDALEIADAATRRRLEAGERPFRPVAYQPVGGGFAPSQTRPWVGSAAGSAAVSAGGSATDGRDHG